jgi:hypothetical protein
MRGFRSQRCFGLDDPVLRGYLLGPTLGENAARAMESTTANCFFDHMFMFEPNTPVDEHYWHQDLPFWPVAGEHIVSIWLSLYDCTPKSAALKFIPGSHHERRFYSPMGFDGTPMVGDLGARADLAVDVRTVHSSGGNNSADQRRLAYSVRFIGDDAPMMLRQCVFQDPALLPDADDPFEVGGPIQSRRWPRVYPITSGA